MPSTLLLTRRHLFNGLIAAAPVISQAKPVVAKTVTPLVSVTAPVSSKIIELSSTMSTSYYLKQSLQLGEMATDLLQREDIDGFYQRTFLSKLLEAYDASVQLIEDDFIRTIMQRGLVHPMSPEVEEEHSERFI